MMQLSRKFSNISIIRIHLFLNIDHCIHRVFEWRIAAICSRHARNRSRISISPISYKIICAIVTFLQLFDAVNVSMIILMISYSMAKCLITVAVIGTEENDNNKTLVFVLKDMKTRMAGWFDSDLIKTLHADYEDINFFYI